MSNMSQKKQSVCFATLRGSTTGTFQGPLCIASGFPISETKGFFLRTEVTEGPLVIL